MERAFGASDFSGLILASASPRRRELLGEIRKDFRVEPSAFEERAGGLSVRDTAKYFARGKAEEVFSRFPQATVLGADTVVSLGGEILGKPRDEEDAKRMLRALSGKIHSVFTGVCVCKKGFSAALVVETEVEFYPLSEALISRYAESGLPLDKAGAYGIQDGFPLVKEFHGSYTNVVGLPVEEVRALLQAARNGNTNVETCD